MSEAFFTPTTTAFVLLLDYSLILVLYHAYYTPCHLLWLW